MRKILLGATVLAAAGAAFLVGPAQAVYNGTNCTGGGNYGVVSTNGVHVGALAPIVGGSTGMETNDPNSVAAGVCLDTGLPTGTFTGGALEAGAKLPSATLTNPFDNTTRLCAQGTDLTTLPTPGVYAIADGHGTSVSPIEGYIGASTYENHSSHQTGNGTTCDTTTGGGGTNSGGSVGVTETVIVNGTPVTVDVTLPIPGLVCGDDTGPSWNNTPRDGCFFDTTFQP